MDVLNFPFEIPEIGFNTLRGGLEGKVLSYRYD